MHDELASLFEPAGSDDPSRTSGGQVPLALVGRIAGIDTRGAPVVEHACDGGAAAAARSIWMARSIDWTACKGLRVVLVFENGDPRRPIIVGLLDEPAAAAVAPTSVPSDAAESSTSDAGGFVQRIDVGSRPTEAADKAESDPTAQPTPETLRLSSTSELVLECGKARISLRADGRVVIEGDYLLSRSSGPNKIMGASVRLN